MRRWSILLALLAISSASPQTRPTPVILAFGDSLTAGYGLDQGLGFAPQLQATLRRHGVRVTVHDAGVSGDTSQAGRDRLGWTLDGLPQKPDLVIVELGANDMLRGLDPSLTRANLDAILAEVRRRDIPVLIAGMRALRNLDPEYVRSFESIYPDLAARHDAALYPFFLEGVTGQPSMVQSDSLHPTFAGIKHMVMAILPAVKQALGR